MKKKIFSVFLIFNIGICGFAQLKVATDGSTTVKSLRESPYALYGENSNIGLKGMRSGYGSDWGYGVYGESGNYYTEHSVGVAGIATSRSGNAYESGHAYGVWGEATLAGAGYNYGVFGRLGAPGQVWGAAVYGTVSPIDNGRQIGGRYAGFFAGNVHMTEDLIAEGMVTCNVMYTDHLYASSADQTANSAALFANEVESFSDKVATLTAVTQYNRPTATTATSATTENAENITTTGLIRTQQKERPHYGLSAEQVEEAFPELVYTTENGSKLINYTELIPILVQSIAELKAEIATLKGTNAPISDRNIKSLTGKENDLSAQEVSSLNQNQPNPFNTSTTIAMNIPHEVQQACLYIYDMNGKQISKTDITERGAYEMTLTASTLEPGMYLYTLITDGKIVATKRMILTK